MEIVPYNDSYYDPWQKFVNNYGNLYHDIRWKDIIENSYNLKPFYYIVLQDKEIIGILPFFIYNKKKLISNPYLPYCGPLFIQDINIDVKEIFSFFNKERGMNNFIVRSKDNMPFKKELAVNDCYFTLIKRLENSIDEAFKNFHYKQRNMIRKANQESFEIKQSSVNEFYKIYSVATNNLGTPPHKKQFFSLIEKAFKNEIRIHVLTLKNIQIGCMLEIDYKNTRYDLWAFSLKKYLIYKPNIYFYWETLKDAINKKIEFYDFGRSIYNEGTYKFKEKWNVIPYQLHYKNYYLIANKLQNKNEFEPLKNKSLSNIWKYIPDLVANFVGPKIRKYLY